MVEKNDYKKYEDPEELRREIQVRITKLNELEHAISGEEHKSEDSSFPQIDIKQLSSLDEKQLAQRMEELDKCVDWEKLTPKQAEDLSNIYAELMRLRKSQLKGFEEDTFWFWKYKKGDTKEIITSTQDVVRSLSNVVIGNTHAIALSFKYHSEMAKFSQFLLGLGCYNIAMNEAIVSDLNDALKKKNTIDKKKLSEKTKERLKEIIKRLKDQQNILQKQNELSKKQAIFQKELEKKIDEQAFNDEIEKYEEYKNRVTKLESSLKIIWITYSVTTAALIAGLILSFSI